MKKLFSFTTALCLSMSVSASDLEQVYQLALQNDVEIAAARATREAGSYNIKIARGALLPQAEASFSRTKINTQGESLNFATQQYEDTENDFTQNSLGVTASMALLDLNSWYALKAAKSGDLGANYELKMAEQQLLLRTADAYFSVLRAKENLSAAQAEFDALERSYEQTQERYEVGLVPVTDVYEAQAAYDLSYANLISQRSNVEVTNETLAILTGEYIEELSPLQDDLRLSRPEPSDPSVWVETGMENYVGLLMAETQLESSRLQRSATRSQRLPSVNVFASYTEEDQPPFGATSRITESTTKAIGIEVKVPLLTGGSLYAQSKQAALNYAASDYRVEAERRNVKQNIRSLYMQVNNDVLTINARKQAIRSARGALDATQTGYEVGTRNIVEVLDAQKNLYRSLGDLANAKYNYIINLLNLKFFSGTLNDGDIAVLNEWLVK